MFSAGLFNWSSIDENERDIAICNEKAVETMFKISF